MPSRRSTPLTTRLFLLVLGWMSIATVTGQLVFNFDCRRPGVDCGGGECDISTGDCDCTDVTGFETNYRCQNKADSPCTESTYGTDCLLERVQVDCRVDNMFVNIYPDGTFTGTVRVFGDDGKTECQLKLKETATIPDYVENKDALQGYSVELPYVGGDCQDAVKTEEVVDEVATITYTREYFIQYNTMFKTSVDQKLSVKCILKDGATSVTGEAREVKEGDGDGGYETVDVDSNADVDIITFSIMGENDQPLPASVSLGDEIKLVFSLTQGTSYVDFSLTSCTANNTIDEAGGGDFRSLTFVDKDCPSEEGQTIFMDGVIKSTSPDTSPITITVSISAFMFSGVSSQVGFECDVKLCREADKEDCKKNQCSGVTSKADKEAEAQTTAAPNANPTTPGTDSQTGNAPTDAATAPAGGAVVTTPANAAPEAATQEAPAAQGGDEVQDATTKPAVETTAAAGVKRRRRRASGDEELPVKVYFDVTVQDSSAIDEDAPISLPVEEKDCMQEAEVITVIAILSVIVVTLTLVTLVVICHVIRGGHANKEKGFGDEMGSIGIGSMVGDHSTRTSTSSISAKGSELRTRADSIHSFNIPRLEIRAQRPVNYAAA